MASVLAWIEPEQSTFVYHPKVNHTGIFRVLFRAKSLRDHSGANGDHDKQVSCAKTYTAALAPPGPMRYTPPVRADTLGGSADGCVSFNKNRAGLTASRARRGEATPVT